MIITVLAIIALISIVLAMKWKIAVLIITAYCEKQGLHPNNDDLKECSDYVAKNIIASLTGRKRPE